MMERLLQNEDRRFNAAAGPALYRVAKKKNKKKTFLLLACVIHDQQTRTFPKYATRGEGVSRFALQGKRGTASRRPD